MLFFVATRHHHYTVAALRKTKCGGHDVMVVPLAYEDLFAAPLLPGGTYVFTDIERLSPLERRLAAEVFREMRAHPQAFRPINDPARVRHRFALLRALHEAGINSFDAYPAEGLPRPARFPVFLKSCSDHGMMVTGLLHDQAALEAALEQVQESGVPLGDLAVIEYCAEPVRPGVWCRYTAFRVGDAILPDLPVTQDSWTVKTGTLGLVSDETYLEHDRMIRERDHAEVLARAFDIARIGYGRVDYGLVAGRPAIYEINTAPNVVAPGKPHPSAVRTATQAQAWAALTARIAALADGHGMGEVVEVETPLLATWRRRSGGIDLGWRP